MDKRPRCRRTTLIINKELQHRIIRHVTLYPLLALLVAATSVGILATRVSGEAAEVYADLPSLVLLLLSVIAFVLVFGLLLIRQALIFSNKIAGPSYRICKSLEQIRNGDLDLRIQLREDDFNTEIAEEINQLLDWIAKRHQVGVASNEDAAPDSVSNQPSREETVPANH
jgi:nitrogen fixation/metabolism regulation signal transduction histidine kinase